MSRNLPALFCCCVGGRTCPHSNLSLLVQRFALLMHCIVCKQSKSMLLSHICCFCKVCIGLYSSCCSANASYALVFILSSPYSWIFSANTLPKVMNQSEWVAEISEIVTIGTCIFILNSKKYLKVEF